MYIIIHSNAVNSISHTMLRTGSLSDGTSRHGRVLGKPPHMACELNQDCRDWGARAAGDDVYVLCTVYDVDTNEISRRYRLKLDDRFLCVAKEP